MSTSRGNQIRKRPQKHQNKTAFKNDLHDTSQKTKQLNSLEVSGVCKRCKDIIEWKIKYKKYKPLAAPSKCVGCNEKAVRHAYHVLCRKCATEKKVCAKCTKPAEDDVEIIQSNTDTNDDTDVQAILKVLPERKRRTVLRHIRKHEEDCKTTSEIKLKIDELLSGINDFTLEDDDFDVSNDEFSGNSDDEK